MKQFLLQEMAKPMLRRVGTAIGGYLIGMGYAASVVDPIVAGLAAAGGIAIDLAMSHWNRKEK